MPISIDPRIVLVVVTGYAYNICKSSPSTFPATALGQKIFLEK